MSALSVRVSLGLCWVGHSFSHIFQPIFFVVALGLEAELGLTHGSVMALIVAGNVLYGVGAPVAGWLSDRWSARGMLAVFFVGTGACMILTGFARSPLEIAMALTACGLFASIYHPVGFAWIARNAVNRGTALGINGVFGGLGPSMAALAAGVLTDYLSWRAAFIVPGAVILATGLVYCAVTAPGLVGDRDDDVAIDPPASRRDRIRAIVVLAIVMLATGAIYYASQAALPKALSERLVDVSGGGLLGVSTLVAAIYLVAGGVQVVSGILSDRFPLKTVYILTFVLQVPFLLIAANAGSTAFIVVAFVMVSMNVASFPPENSLIARYVPNSWRGVAYGLKFVIIFGVGGLGVMMEGALYDLTGGFYWLFVILAVMAAFAAAVATRLPGEKRETAAALAE